DAAGGALQPDHRLPPAARPGRGAADRRTQRDPCAPVAGPVQRLLPVSQHAHLADALARRHAGPRPASDGVGCAHLPGAGPRTAPGGGGAPPGPPRTRMRRAVLCDVDLDVPAGRTIAVVGATGSGKTSLVSLISRLYDVSSGAVLLDGADVRTVDLPSLRRAV